MQESAVVFSFQRTDLKGMINGEPVPTALGSGSWTAWKAMGNEFMIMGDLVLFEREINPVISALADANINVTALHNHFIGEEPRIVYMHIGGMGPSFTWLYSLLAELAGSPVFTQNPLTTCRRCWTPVEFGRFATRHAKERGKRMETVSFLGFTHFCTINHCCPR